MVNREWYCAEAPVRSAAAAEEAATKAEAKDKRHLLPAWLHRRGKVIMVGLLLPCCLTTRGQSAGMKQTCPSATDQTAGACAFSATMHVPGIPHASATVKAERLAATELEDINRLASRGRPTPVPKAPSHCQIGKSRPTPTRVPTAQHSVSTGIIGCLYLSCMRRGAHLDSQATECDAPRAWWQ